MACLPFQGCFGTSTTNLEAARSYVESVLHVDSIVVSIDVIDVDVLLGQLFCKTEQIKDVPVHASISYRSGSGAFSTVPSLNDVAVLRNEGGVLLQSPARHPRLLSHKWNKSPIMCMHAQAYTSSIVAGSSTRPSKPPPQSCGTCIIRSGCLAMHIQAGSYQFSFALPDKDTASGEYKVCMPLTLHKSFACAKPETTSATHSPCCICHRMHVTYFHDNEQADRQACIKIALHAR